jgi:CheY-like chemotaxis protein
MAHRCPLHILLAEDNVVNQKVALRMLEKMGYRADVATNGLDVLDVLEWRLYDVVLMDVQMPEMDGLEATHRIRTAWPAERQPYIVAMTAHAMQGDRERCLESGMDDYISKPVQVTELAGALLRAGEQKSVVPLMRKEKLMQPEGKGTPIDYEVLELLQMTLGDDEPGILRELIDAYLEDTPRLLADLRLSVDQSSVDLLTRTAHSLKSSSAQLGALNLSAICQELETNGRTGSLEGAAERIAQIEEEYQRVEQALSKVAQEKP